MCALRYQDRHLYFYVQPFKRLNQIGYMILWPLQYI